MKNTENKQINQIKNFFRNCSTWNNFEEIDHLLNIFCHTKDDQLLNNSERIENYLDQYLNKVESYIDLLLAQNATMNLIAKSTIDDIYNRHVLDSLQLINYLSLDDKIITDLGSGAGFPAVILALLNIWQVNLVESKQKKCKFLKEATNNLKNVKIYNSRIEDLPQIKSDVIIARALAPLDKLLELSHRFNHPNIKYLFLKGEKTLEEIKIAKEKFKFDYNLHPSLTNNKAFIINITNLKKKGY